MTKAPLVIALGEVPTISRTHRRATIDSVAQRRVLLILATIAAGVNVGCAIGIYLTP